MPNADATLPYSARFLKDLLAVAPLCTFREHRILIAYACRAGEDGVAWPSVAQLAEDTCLSPRHVKEAIKSLLSPAAQHKQQRARQPLLETLVAGGGAGHSARRRLLIDGDRTVPDAVTVSENEKGARTGTKRVPNLTQKGARSVSKRVPDPGPRRRNKEGIEEGMEDSAAAGGGAVVADGSEAEADDGMRKKFKSRVKRVSAAGPHRDTKPPSDHKATVDFFGGQWERRYGAKYPFRGGADGSAIKAILDYDGPAKARSIITAYFADTDSFVVKHRHSLTLLRSRLAQYVAERVPAPVDPDDEEDPPVPTAEQYFDMYREDGITFEQCVAHHEAEMRLHEQRRAIA